MGRRREGVAVVGGDEGVEGKRVSQHDGGRPETKEFEKRLSKEKWRRVRQKGGAAPGSGACLFTIFTLFAWTVFCRKLIRAGGGTAPEADKWFSIICMFV